MVAGACLGNPSPSGRSAPPNRSSEARQSDCDGRGVSLHGREPLQEHQWVSGAFSSIRDAQECCLTRKDVKLVDQTVPLWVVLVLPFAGYIAAAATEYLRGQQALNRERQARSDARKAAREAARDAFERETLLEFQDVMASLMRNAARILHESEMEFRQSGTWGRRLLPEAIGGEASVSLARDFHRLRVRVLDDALREESKEWWLLCAAATIGVMRNEPDKDARQRANDAWTRSTAIYEELAEAIGERLRTRNSLG